MSLLRQRKRDDALRRDLAIYRAVRTRGLRRRGEIATQTTEEARHLPMTTSGRCGPPTSSMDPPCARDAKASQKLYLLAIIDDATRFVVHAHFYTTEGIVALVHGLSEAITRFGIPERFYTDNGSAFRTLHLQTIAARLDSPCRTHRLQTTGARQDRTILRDSSTTISGRHYRRFSQGMEPSLREWIDRYHHARHETPPGHPIGAATLHTKPPAPFPRRGRSSQEGIPPGGATQGPPRWNRPARWCHWDVPGALPGEVVNILHAPWVPEQILVGPDHKVAKARRQNRQRHTPPKTPSAATHTLTPKKDTHKEKSP
ncbi:MAG: transposase family protein [Fibrobacteres bacterium]|nr:transposase family protein [Fibrobacterota bacterium]